jgi:hypothetical protein
MSSSSLDVFRLDVSTPEEAWLHGRAQAAAWLTGSLSAQDGLDVTGEFDARVGGRLGRDVTGVLKGIEAESSGQAHAGVRLQVAAPLDVFTAAGLSARLRLEASVNGQVSVTVSLSLEALEAAVLAELPEQVRPYLRILMDQAQISAGVWAHGSLAVKLNAELVSTVSLFPTDGSAAGVTSFLRYGYGWGYGGGWGTIVNVGFDPQRLIEGLAGQVAADVQRALPQRRGGDPLDPSSLLTALVPRMAGRAVLLLGDVARASLTTPDRDVLGDALSSFWVSLRPVLISWLLDLVARAASDLITAAGVADLPPATYTQLWDAVDQVLDGLDGGGEDDLDGYIQALAVVVPLLEQALPSPAGDVARSAVRCALALALLAAPQARPDPALIAAAFPGGTAAAGGSPRAAAVEMITRELATLLEERHLLPDWAVELLGDAAGLVALLLDSGASRTVLLAALARTLDAVLVNVLDTPEGEAIVAELPEGAALTVRAAARLLSEFCAPAGHADPQASARHLREGVSLCLLTLVGEPLAGVIRQVATTGLHQVAPSLRQAAELVAADREPPSLSWSWQEVARASAGVAVGLPTATLLNLIAGSAENWCDLVLPQELDFLTRRLAPVDTCRRILTDDSARAISDHKAEFLRDLATHLIGHLVATLEFAVADSARSLVTLLSGLGEQLVRGAEISAIVAFKAFEESIAAAEHAGVDIQHRINDLEVGLAGQLAQLLGRLRDVAREIRAVSASFEDRLTAGILQAALGLGGGRGVEDPVLRALVQAGVDAFLGGLGDRLQKFAGTLADTLDVLTEGMLARSSSTSEPGVRGFLQDLWGSSTLPPLVIPIVLPIPNPFLPGVLPDIEVELFRIELPPELVGRIAVDALLGLLGAGPLLAALDTTVESLRGTRIALEQAKGVLGGQHINEQRQALADAAPVGPLAVDVVAPANGATTGSRGVLEFSVRGANMSFVRPGQAGLPQSIGRRIRVLVNGRLVTDDVRWTASPDGLTGSLTYATRDSHWGDLFVTSPVTAVVTVTDGTGADRAVAIWGFVAQALPTVLTVTCCTRRYVEGSHRIAVIGGLDSTRAPWRLRVEEALVLHDRGSRFQLSTGVGPVPLQVAHTRAGRRYLRAGRRTPPMRLTDLPECP